MICSKPASVYWPAVHILYFRCAQTIVTASVEVIVATQGFNHSTDGFT